MVSNGIIAKAKKDWVYSASCQVVDHLRLCDFSILKQICSDLNALNADDAKIDEMKNNDKYECALCTNKYSKKGWFKKHLIKKHKWKFHDIKPQTKQDYNAIQCFLQMSLILRDTCNAYRMGDGDRIIRNAYFEWLYAGGMNHTKYKLWLWRMIAYVIAILNEEQSFEYKWNMTVNLKGGIQNNIITV